LVECYRLSRVVVFWGSEEILGGLADTDAVMLVGAVFLPEGHRVYPFPTSLRVLREILELVWAATSSSSYFFLKVLLGTR
jgi:hypothetical protein